MVFDRIASCKVVSASATLSQDMIGADKQKPKKERYLQIEYINEQNYKELATFELDDRDEACITISLMIQNSGQDNSGFNYKPQPGPNVLNPRPKDNVIICRKCGASIKRHDIKFGSHT